MKISWLAKEEDANLASFRYRIALPAFVLASQHKVSLGETGDVVVASKHFERPETAERLRASGKAVVFDCCDNHLGTQYRDYYLRMCRVAHVVTVPTPEMQRVLGEEGIESVVVPDPYEFPWAEPKVGGVKRLFWYGHVSNIKPLVQLMESHPEYEYRVISNLEADWVRPWSLKEMLDGFGWCDAVVIPQEQTAKTACKSPNRVVEGIWSGRFVCASPIPAYEQFAPYAWIGDVVEGLEWLKANPREALERVKAGQAYIAANFAPVDIAKKWLAVFEDALGRR